MRCNWMGCVQRDDWQKLQIRGCMEGDHQRSVFIILGQQFYFIVLLLRPWYIPRAKARRKIFIRSIKTLFLYLGGSSQWIIEKSGDYQKYTNMASAFFKPSLFYYYVRL